jgi:hypothetical protein
VTGGLILIFSCGTCGLFLVYQLWFFFLSYSIRRYFLRRGGFLEINFDLFEAIVFVLRFEGLLEACSFFFVMTNWSKVIIMFRLLSDLKLQMFMRVHSAWLACHDYS